MEPCYTAFGHDGYQYPPYFRSPAACGKCYIYRGKSAHVWVGEQVDEYTAIVINGDHLVHADFCDDTAPFPKGPCPSPSPRHRQRRAQPEPG